jgi:hypothetical protein
LNGRKAAAKAREQLIRRATTLGAGLVNQSVIYLNIEASIMP